MNLTRYIIICLFLLAIASCGSNISTSLFSTNEMVMSEGMVIEAINNNGSIKVQADKGMKRVVYIDNQRLNLDMIPRSKRWNGSLGAYCPGGGDPIHIVIEEGQQHFCSINEAMEWLDWQDNRMNYVYTSDGLVVGCEIHSNSDGSVKKSDICVTLHPSSLRRTHKCASFLGILKP